MNPKERQARVSAVIADCMLRKDSGHVVDPAQVLSEHPELADELRRYFETDQQLGAAFGPSGAEPAASARRETARPEGDSVPSAAGGFDRLPVEFGRYRVTKVLGQGAMGAVYLAHDTKLARDVALKTPKLDLFSDAELVQRFEREARAAAALHHPGICPIFDVGEIDGVRFLTMAWIQGKPLSTFVSEEKPLSRRQAASVVRKLAIALQEAHHHGVVHRDLKPANVMIDKSGEPVVMDFGLAHQTKNANQSRLTGAGVLIGSPAYMSPEQVDADQNEVGPGTDIYSLGVILFELLTGRLPFEGSVVAIIGQILTAEPPDVRTVRPDVDEKLSAICRRLMARSPADRYASMRDVAAALTEYLKDSKKQPRSSGRQSVVVPDLVFDEIAGSHPPQRQATSPAGRRSPARRPKSTAMWVATALVALAGIAGVIIHFSDGTTVEVPDGRTVTVESNPDGTLRRLTVQPGDDKPNTPPNVKSLLPRAAESAPTSAEGSVALFNGSDVSGWRMTDQGGWAARDGVLVGTGRSWIMTDAEFRDFELELEYELATDGNSGVFLRAWPEGSDSGADFHEIQLLDDTSDKYADIPASQRTGSLWNALAAQPVLRPAPNRWHQLQVTLRGRNLQVAVNGQQVVDGRIPGGKRNTGRIGLQAHGSRVRFRNIRVRRLSADPVAAAGSVASSSAAAGLPVEPEPATARPNVARPDLDGRGPISVPMPGDARELAISPDSSWLAVTGADSPGRITLIETDTGRKLRQFDDPERPGLPMGHLAVSPDGEFLIYKTGSGVRVISATDGTQQAWYQFPASPVLAVFPDRPWALAIYLERPAGRKEAEGVPVHLRIWNWKTGEVLLESLSPEQSAGHPAVSPGGRFITLGNQHQHVRFTVDATNDNVRLLTRTNLEQTSRVRSALVYSPDGKYAACSLKSPQGIAVVLDILSGRVLTQIDRSTAAASIREREFGCRLGFTPDSSQLVTADHNGRCALWNLPDGSFVAQIDSFQADQRLACPAVLVSSKGHIIFGGGTQDQRLTIHRFKLSGVH